MTDRAAISPLTAAHQGLAACLAVICLRVTGDQGAADAAEMAAEILPQAHGDHPTAEILISATRQVLAAWPHRGTDGMRWQLAMNAAGAAAAAYYKARAAACHAVIFPQPQHKDAAAHV